MHFGGQLRLVRITGERKACEDIGQLNRIKIRNYLQQRQRWLWYVQKTLGKESVLIVLRPSHYSLRR